MEADDLRGVGDEAVGELGDVDKTVLMDTDVDEDAEVGDVRHDASEFHSYDEVVEGVDIFVELEDFNLSTWVTSRLLKLGEDVTEGCLTQSPYSPLRLPRKEESPICGVSAIVLMLVFFAVCLFIFRYRFMFCLNHDCWMFFFSWVVYISKEVDRENVRGLNTPWQCFHYTLG